MGPLPNLSQTITDGEIMKSFVLALWLTSVCFANVQPPIRISNDGSKSPLLVVRSYDYAVKEQQLGVEFQLGKEDGKKLFELSRQNVGKKLSFRIGEGTVNLVKVLDPITDGKIWLTVDNKQDLHELELTLTNKTEQK
jgi:hypothetical protein